MLSSCAAGAEGTPTLHKQQDPHPHCCCGSQPPLAQGASETAHSKGFLYSSVQAEHPTLSLLQIETLSSTDPSPPRNFGWFPTPAGQKLAEEKQSTERGEPAKVSFLYKTSTNSVLLTNIETVSKIKLV